MAELYFIQKVDQGLKDIEEGQVLSQEEVRRQMAQWAKSIGQ
jgi:predicted transcriptional regulator